MRRGLGNLLVTAIVLVMVVGGCAACGGSSAPGDPSPPSLVPSGSPSPTRTPPPLPPAATKATKAGAVAFVRHYIDLLNYAQATGDVGPSSVVESPTCRSCARARAYLRSVYERGVIVGGAWKLRRLIGIFRTPRRDEFSVATIVAFGAQRVRRGTRTQHLKGGSLGMSFFVALQHHDWEVLECTRAR